MHLEAVVVDARDPASLGRFWAESLWLQVVESGVEGTRLALSTEPELFLDLVPVADRDPRPHRLHLDLDGGSRPQAMVDRMLALGAQPVDIGQGDVPWTVLVDPEDYAFCVMPGERYDGRAGPVAALPLDSDDPEASATFWAAATGWEFVEPLTLRHPSGRGPLLEICDPVEPKRGKNPVHLDLRATAGEDHDEQVRRLLELGGTLLEHDWGDLPWTVLLDPGGNECCLLRGHGTDREP